MNELRNHIIKLFESNTRLDGRKLDEFRKPITLEYGVTNTAEGSARVKIGETEVMVGVKVEVMEPYPDQPDRGSLMVGAELLPMSNPEFEPGPPGIAAVEIARVVDRGIRESECIDFKKLCVKEGEKAWFLLIDIISINDEGNLLDAASLGALAALKDMNFPKLDGDKIDYKEKTKQKLEITKNPIAITVIKIGQNFIVDAGTEEEKVVDARLTVTSLDDGSLCSLQKGGDYPLSAEDVDKMIDIAVEKAKDLRKLLK
jgi:exosome complex component RRP42|tara:strand:- start:46 stop:819 length:774 start_codon:yes stop_codon:yes gene_type:complete